MELTRRSWAVVGLAFGLTGFAVVLERPFVLTGTMVVGVWLASRQYLFYRAVTDLSEGANITQQPAKTAIRTGETVPTTLRVRRDDPQGLTCTVTAGLPLPTATVTPISVTLTPHQTDATVTADVRWPVAGEQRFTEPEITATDGLFRATFSAGPTPTVTVEPRGPRNLHVGEGGDRIATAYGEHDTGRLGSGLEPAELREYVPGDTADRIDWNATARLGTPYVREFDAETDRQTILVVDQRHSLAAGGSKETKLDYLRELALAITDSANQLGDPLGFIAVGDEGITEQLHPSTQPEQYTAIRRALLTLETTAPSSMDSESLATPTSDRGRSASLADVRRSLALLENDKSSFAETLRPFYADRQVYLDRIGTDPLYTTVRTMLGREQGAVFTVLCTDDSSPTELLETVKLASRGAGTVLVFLAPTVLYEQGGLANVEQAYEQYLDFEELRRDLSRIDGVTALEVGPSDRLGTVLTAGRNRRSRRPNRGEL